MVEHGNESPISVNIFKNGERFEQRNIYHETVQPSMRSNFVISNMEIKKRPTQDVNGKKCVVNNKNKWRSITPTSYITAREH